MPHDTFHPDGSSFIGRLDTVTRSATQAALEREELRLPGVTVLCHPNLQRIGERAVLPALSSGQEVNVSRLEPLFSQPGSERRRPLGDPRLSRSALVIRPEGDGIALLDPAGRLRVTVGGERLSQRRFFDRAEIERGIVWVMSDQVTLVLSLMDPLPSSEPSFGLVGESPSMQEVRRHMSRVADLDVPCMIRGETGTGKELVARGIHQASPRRRALEAVNMGAVPPSLAASELFGVVKGAFTGADRKRDGAFARADGGTLFLDEIGETPQEVQALLLRALETGTIRPVGAEEERHVSVRLLAATDADLEAAVEAGRFREPLIHRLSGYEIHLPPLRDRIEDLGRLLVHFLRIELEPLGEVFRLDAPPGRRAWLPAPLVARLAAFSWPGNVRQLRNVVRRLVIANRGKEQLQVGPELEAQLTDDRRGKAAARAEATLPAKQPEAGEPGASKTGVRALAIFRFEGDTEDHDRHLRLLRRLDRDHGGLEIEPELFAFETPVQAVAMALRYCEEGSPPAGAAAVCTAAVELVGAEERPLPGLSDLRKARTLVRSAPPGRLWIDAATHGMVQSAADPGDDAPLKWTTLESRELPGLEAPQEIFEATFPADEGEAEASKPAYRSPDEVGEQELLSTLKRFRFRLQPAAAALNVSRTSLYALIERSARIRKAKDLSAAEIEDAKNRHGGDLDAMAAELEVSRKGLRRQMTRLGFD